MPFDPKSKDVAQLRKRQHASQWGKYECEICLNSEKKPQVLNGLIEWENHKKSRSHRHNVKRQKKALEKKNKKE